MKYRHFTLSKLNNKELELGRVKISSKSGTPLDAAKKLLKTVCSYEGLTKNKKLKCKAIFYIRETTERCNKIYGPYKGTYKKYNKPVIVTLKDGRQIKHFYYPDVVKIKESKSKKIIQKGGEAVVYNYSSDNCITLDNGDNQRQVFCYSKDGTKIALYSHLYPSRIDIFDSKTGNKRLSFDVTFSSIYSICYHPDGIFIAIEGDNGRNTTFEIWNSDTGVRVDDSTIKKDYSLSSLYKVCYSPDGEKICAANYEKGRRQKGNVKLFIHIWNSNTGDELLTIKIDKYLKELPFEDIYLKRLSFSPDGRKIAASINWKIPTGINNKTHTNGMVKIFDSSNGNILLNIYLGDDNSIFSMCFSPNGEKIATSSSDGKIRIWKSYTKKKPLLIRIFGVPIKKTPLLTFPNNYDFLRSLDYSPNGSQIAGLDDKGVYIWDSSRGDLLFVLNFNESVFNVIPNSLCYSPYDKKIAIGYSGYKRYSIYRPGLTYRSGLVNVGFINIIDLISNNLININNTVNIFSLNIPKEGSKKFKIIDLYKKTFTNYEFLYDKTKNLNLESFDLCKFYTNLLIVSFNNNYNIFGEDNIGTFINNVVQFIYSLKKSKNNKRFTNQMSIERETKLLSFYSDFLYEYLKIMYNMYNKEASSNNQYSERPTLTVKRDNELDMILKHLYRSIYDQEVKIEFKDEEGVNASGLSKTYFYNLENQLNTRIRNGPKIDLNIIIRILRFSKINKLPIYINDETLKNLVLEKIISGVKREHSKGILQKLLLYNGDVFSIDDLRLHSENLNLNFSGNNYETIKSETIKKIKEKNNEKNNKYNNSKETNSKKTNSKKTNNNNPIIEIKKYIPKIYKNYLDFYLSHFIKFTFNAEDIIKNIKYENENDEFKENFENFLKSLSQEELILFNIAISGTSTLRSEYQINVVYTNGLKLPDFHTCYNQMNIHYSIEFKNKYFNKVNGKENFMDVIRNVAQSEYNLF